MKTKVLIRNKSHIRDRSHDVSVEKIGNKIVKFTYECYNGGKRFDGHIFDGTEWKPFFTLHDLGILYDGSMSSTQVTYVSDSSKREMDRDELYKKGLKYVQSILSEC